MAANNKICHLYLIDRVTIQKVLKTDQQKLLLLKTWAKTKRLSPKKSNSTELLSVNVNILSNVHLLKDVLTEIHPLFCYGNPTQEIVHKALKYYIVPGSKLFTDKDPTHRKPVKELHLQNKEYNSKECK